MLCSVAVLAYRVVRLWRCYREWLNWPQWLPIPVYGDHGVALSSALEPHERTNRGQHTPHMVKERAANNENLRERRVLRIQHPWVTFRRAAGIDRHPEHRGTLIFYSHSNDGIEIEGYDFKAYFDKLRRLPEEYHPFVVCMHMHDVRKQYYKIARSLGLPVVTCGNTSSARFVERFYDLTSRFSFATSNLGGSEVLLLHRDGNSVLHLRRTAEICRSIPPGCRTNGLYANGGG